MTGRTHDLAAFTTLTCYLALQPLPTISVGTAFFAFTANLIGGLAPDIDQPTSSLWNRVPAGSLFGRLINPLLGNHRMVSHSVFGVIIAGVLTSFLLQYTKKFILVDNFIVWSAFMFGYVSHLLMDSLTKEGVPWLFPIPIRFGFPPFRFLRITTGAIIEKLVVYPGLIIFNVYLVNLYRVKFLEFFTRHIIR